MNIALWLLVLALLWTAITGAFTALNLVLGLAIAILALFLLRDKFGSAAAFNRLRAILALAGYFFAELVASAVRVALLTLLPNIRKNLRPAVIAVPLTVNSDAAITLLANLITLTPGTLSIDVSDDRSLLFVHVLALTDREHLIASIANGFETRIKAVLQ